MRTRQKATTAMTESNGTEILDRLLEQPADIGTNEAPRKIDGVVTGRLVALDPLGNPLVVFHGITEPVSARATVVLEKRHTGREVVLMFENGTIDAPIILGLIEKPAPQVSSLHAQEKPSRPDKVEIDGKSLVLTAESEVVLRCGDASITLTRAGKILIRGTYVVSRSSGVNRIKGGVVHIN
jgi:hypothetical protein